MKVKKDYKIFIIIIIILICILGLIFLSDKKKENVVKKDNKFVLVSDYSDFFTVNSSINKFVSYLSSSKLEDVVLVLNSEFKEQNNINVNNVNDFFPKLNGLVSFVSKKIFYQNSEDNKVVYYVYGYFEEETIDSIGKKSDYYFKVVFNNDNQTFDIMPLSENIYNEVQNG